jgi:hypothetical protein
MVTPPTRRHAAWRIGAQLAEELHLALLARGFYLPTQVAEPIDGRAYVSIEPVRDDVAVRPIEVLGPAQLTPVVLSCPADPYEEAEGALRDLRRALFDARITLPSLGLDEPCGDRRSVLVELGNATPGTVRQLAAVIGKGALSTKVALANARSQGERL